MVALISMASAMTWATRPCVDAPRCIDLSHSRRTATLPTEQPAQKEQIAPKLARTLVGMGVEGLDPLGVGDDMGQPLRPRAGDDGIAHGRAV